MVSPTRPPKYLAICVSTNRIYKTLIEIDVTDLASDAGLFAAMKRQYRAVRGYKAHFPSLFKPISVEFVHVSTHMIVLRNDELTILPVQPMEHSPRSRLHLRPPRMRSASNRSGIRIHSQTITTPSTHAS